MTTAAPAEYVRDRREELTDLALDLLAVDTSNPPGDTREVADAVERFLDPLPVAVERVAVDPAKPNLLVRVPGASNRTLL
jgi:succinyl-diaminopimelate desuccinylase